MHHMHHTESRLRSVLNVAGSAPNRAKRRATARQPLCSAPARALLLLRVFSAKYSPNHSVNVRKLLGVGSVVLLGF